MPVNDPLSKAEQAFLALMANQREYSKWASEVRARIAEDMRDRELPSPKDTTGKQ